MTNYIIRRVLLNLIVLWMVATLVFLGTHALPSDYATKRASAQFEQVDQSEAIALAKKELGLDKSMPEQYVTFMGDLIRGDLGRSYETRRTTWTELKEKLPATLELGFMIALVSFAIAIPVGVISAVRQNTWVDYLLRGFAILAVATPVFAQVRFVYNRHNWQPAHVVRARSSYQALFHPRHRRRHSGRGRHDAVASLSDA
jgi:peptide/nickel transport system permease protein